METAQPARLRRTGAEGPQLSLGLELRHVDSWGLDTLAVDGHDRALVPSFVRDVHSKAWS